MRNALKFVCGSVATYVVMAACSAGSAGIPAPRASAGSTSAGGASASNAGSEQGGNAGSLGATLDAALDALTDPVPDAAADPATDGSRLKAVYQVGSDGSKQFAGWWDSQRGEECNFFLFANGETRCAPTPYGIVTPGFFADAGCTVPLYASASTSCATGPKYGYSYSVQECPPYTGIFSFSPANIAQVFMGTPTACTDASAYLKTYSFYSLTAVPLSSFVAATRQHS